MPRPRAPFLCFLGVLRVWPACPRPGWGGTLALPEVTVPPPPGGDAASPACSPQPLLVFRPRVFLIPPRGLSEFGASRRVSSTWAPSDSYPFSPVGETPYILRPPTSPPPPLAPLAALALSLPRPSANRLLRATQVRSSPWTTCLLARLPFPTPGFARRPQSVIGQLDL